MTSELRLNTLRFNVINLATKYGVVLLMFILLSYFGMGAFLSQEENESCYVLVSIAVDLIYVVSVGAYFISRKCSDKRILKLISLLTIAVAISGAVNGTGIGRIALPMIFFGYLYLFEVVMNSEYTDIVNYLVIAFCLVWVIVPVVLFVITQDGNFFSADGTFRGFANHKNGYGYFAGLFILLCSYKQRKISYILILVASYGLFLSGCRSAMTALGLCACWYLINRSSGRKRQIISVSILLILCVMAGILYLYFDTIFTFLVSSDPERSYLILYSLDFLSNNWLFGIGTTFSVDRDDSPIHDSGDLPIHNFILQILSSYGIFTLLIYIALQFYQFRRFHISAQILFVYIFTIGFFQPEVQVGISLFYLVVVLIAVNYHKKYIMKEKKSG